MKVIKITANKKIKALQKEFNELFPYLKLEFFQRTHANHRGSLQRDILDSELSLRSSHKKDSYGAIVLKEDMTVAELEALFQKYFGLSAQVFRKSGRSWIETTVTDDWTLKQQNDEGKELSFLSKNNEK